MVVPDILIFVAALAGLILGHELGHFVAARLSGVRIDEFGIGFPPRIATLFVAGGTRYSINAIPLGGFVRPAGEDDPTVPNGLAGARKLVRAFVLISGPGANFLLAIVAFTAAYKFAFGDAGLAQATIFFITSSLLNNSLGVYVATVGRLSPSQALLGLVRVPAVYAIPLAFLVRMARIELPLALWRPVELIAAAAVPMMLLILGMQMAGEDFRAPGRLVWLAAGFRLLASPLIALVLAPSFGLTGVGYKAGILESAMPSAVLSSIIALEFDAQPAFVSAVVLVTTLLSPLTLTPLLAILGP